MSKIILGYEKLFPPHAHQGWNFNGRVQPSSVQLSEEEIEQLGHYEKFIYRNVIAPERFPATHRPILSDANSMREITWTRKQVSEIGDQTYFYPIEILGMPTYTRYTSHIAINDKTLKDIRDGKAYLIFSYIHEGNLSLYEAPLAKFCKLVQELNLPKNKVLMFHGDQNVHNYKDMPFSYYPANGIYTWLSCHRNHPLVEYSPNKLFLAYVRNTHHHRIMMLKRLRDLNVLDTGLYSFGKTSIKLLDYYNNAFLQGQLTEEDKQFFLSIQNKSPDNKDFDTDGCQQSIPLEDHKNTFVSIITETLPETVFITEKTYKAIAIGHPFIVLSGKGQLAKMRKDGFRTFNSWWDESYDDCDTFLERINKIADVISYLKQKSPEQLVQMREDMRTVLAHNQQVFRTLIANPYGPHKDIADKLLEIVNNS